MLNMTGKAFNAHIVEDLISRECAFVCSWEGKEVRVAHHKGSWFLVKFKGKKFEDRLMVSDDSSYATNNGLLLGLVRSLDEQEPQIFGDDGQRRRLGKALRKLIDIWAGSTDEIKEIECKQVGRNSWLDEDGKFSFSPDNK